MKEDYIKMRNKKIVDTNFFYQYALLKGFKGTFAEFNAGAIHLMVDHAFDHLDREFELTTLHDKQGNFIKIVE
jgi:hypothetical protein